MSDEKDQAVAPIVRKKKVAVEAPKIESLEESKAKSVDLRNAQAKVVTYIPRVEEKVEVKAAQKIEPIFEETTFEQGSLEDFEALLNSDPSALPQAEQYSVGDKVEATVDRIGAKWIYLFVGYREAIADIEEYTDKTGNLELAVDDTKSFFITAIRDQTLYLGERLNTKEAASEAVAVSFESGIPIEGRITGLNKGGFEIDIRGVRAFCPISQIQLSFCEDPDVHLGQSYIFKVIEFAEGGKKIVLSRSALLKVQAEERVRELMDTINEGDVIEGQVTRLADFGAFVDIGGVEGLVHVSELGWSRVQHPSEVVSTGDRVRVTIKSIDAGDDKGPRISLSMKSAEGDPWLNIESNFSEGDTFTGMVTRVESYGAFVQVTPGVDGLVHISELSWDDRVRDAGKLVQVGQHVAVKILNIDLVEQRVGLSVKAAQNDPWSDISASFQVGMAVKGSVERVQDFGVFVSVALGVTALIPRSEMNLQNNDTPFRVFKEGAELSARVISIDPIARRMALSLKDESVEETGPSSYTDSGTTGLGTFADLFKGK